MSSFNSMNKVMLIGRLGRDPELKYANSGTAITNFSVATSERVKKGDNWEEKTEWHNIVAFSYQAESSAKYLKKGSLVFVEGRIQTRSYQDREGVEKYRTEIIANTVKFLDSRESGGDQNRTYQQEKPKNTAKPDNLVIDGEDDDDLPF